MVDVTHDFTGLIVGGSLEDEVGAVLVPIGAWSQDGIIGSNPAAGAEAELPNAIYLDTTNQPGSTDYDVSSPTKCSYSYRSSIGVVVRGQTLEGECYVASWRSGFGWCIEYYPGAQYGSPVVIVKEAVASPHPANFELVKFRVDGTGGSIAFVLTVEGSVVLAAGIGAVTQIDAIGYGGMMVRGSASTDVLNESLRINDSAVSDTGGPTADVSPTLNTDEWTPGVNADFSDSVSATVTNHVIAILAGDTTPTALQVSEGKNSAGTVLAADLRTSATVNSGVADILRCQGASVDGGKLCLVSADASLNLSMVYIVNFPARGAIVSTETDYVASTTLTVVDQTDPNATVILLAVGPGLDDSILGDLLEIADPADTTNWTYTKARVIGYDADGHADGARRALVKKLIPTFVFANGYTVKTHISLSEVKVGEVDGVFTGNVIGTPTTTTAVLSIGVAYDGQFVGSLFKPLGGPAAGTGVLIEASAASTGTITFKALPAAPVNLDTFKIA